MKISITCITFLLMSQFSVGQYTFADGAEYFTFRHGVQLGTQSYDSYFKESVQLDSSVLDSEYYTIYRSEEDALGWQYIDSISYKLRLTDKKVYYTGNFYSDTNKITATVKDVLFYDFSLKAGDTLFSIEPQSLQAYTCIIDSVRTITYQDGKPRVTQFARGYRNATPNQPSGYFRFIEGIGSAKGLMYQNIIGLMPDLSLMSICKDDSLTYLDSSFYNWIPGDYCDEEHIKKLMVSVHDFEQMDVEVFPNPASNLLYLPEGYVGRYKIINKLGQVVLSGDISNKIDITSLSPEIYFIQLFSDDLIATVKFIKEG